MASATKKKKMGLILIIIGTDNSLGKWRLSSLVTLDRIFLYWIDCSQDAAVDARRSGLHTYVGPVHVPQPLGTYVVPRWMRLIVHPPWLPILQIIPSFQNKGKSFYNVLVVFKAEYLCQALLLQSQRHCFSLLRG